MVIFFREHMEFVLRWTYVQLVPEELTWLPRAPSNCSSPSSFTGATRLARCCLLVLGGSGLVRVSLVAFHRRSSFVALFKVKSTLLIYTKLCSLLFIALLPRPAPCLSRLLELGWLGKSKAIVFDNCSHAAACRRGGGVSDGASSLVWMQRLRVFFLHVSSFWK